MISERTHTLVDLLRSRLFEQARRQAYTFLHDGETEEINLTYADLDEQARSIAAQLQAARMAGERVLLLYPPGLNYIAAFLGCLYAGAVAVPVYSPRANRTLLRLQAIMEDAQAKMALTTRAVFSRMEPLLAQAPAFNDLNWLSTDDVSVNIAADWKDPDIDGNTLALLQYTSGSTGKPKGVKVSHGNLMHNQEMIRRAFRQTPESVIVSWLPLYHDMGLIGGVLQPLFVNAHCILMSPASFLQRPARWLQAISRYRATTSGGPNFAYDMCVRKISVAERAEFDLSSWSVAFNGSEPVRAETMERFAEAFGPCGFRQTAFYPCYGLAEATLFVSGAAEVRQPLVKTIDAGALGNHHVVESSSSEAATRSLVGCGNAFLDQEIVIVDPESLTPRGPNEIGEIWVTGESVAKGYWNRPEETAETFAAQLANTNDKSFLRTGDLGFIRDNELFVTGRLKDLIIIRGRNLYPQDIERTVEQCDPSLRRGGTAAFSVDIEGEERLVVIQELERRASPNFDEVIGRIRQVVVEEHEIRPHVLLLVEAGSIPKTSSGKLQRRACRDLFLSGSLKTLGQWQEVVTTVSETAAPASDLPAFNENDDLETWLRILLASTLGVSEAEIDLHQPLTHYGLDSLQVIELMHTLEARLGVVISMESLLQSPSVAELAAMARQQLDTGHASMNDPVAVGTVSTQQLSIGQQALWFLSRIAPDNVAHNIAVAIRLRNEINVPAMRRAFQALVDRHPSLRTTFTAVDGTPLAQISERVEVSLEVTDASHLSEMVLQEHLSQLSCHVFDLEAGPLFRVDLMKRGAAEYVLMMVAHHIVIDFWSLSILLHELGALYEAEQRNVTVSLTPITLQYSDYVDWQTRMLEEEQGERLLGYWTTQLENTPPPLDLNSGRPRPPVKTHRGASHAFKIDAETTRKLKMLAQSQEATLYMTLLAAFQVLLYRHTGQPDIVVGSPSTGRSRAALAATVGYFVNPLVLRSDLSGQPSFEQLLEQVRQTVLDAFAHQDYPFALLVKNLQPERDPDQTPLFQVMFAFQQTQLLREQGLGAFAVAEAGAQLKLGELLLECMPLDQRIAQFDLSLAMAESDNALVASLEYNTDVFDPAVVKQLASHFRVLLESIVADPGQRITQLRLLEEAERRQLLQEFNETGVSESELALHQFFERQAATGPADTALLYGEEQISYGELNERANQLAHYLRSLGVGPETLVGVLLERTPDLIVALLAVLKAGAAYVPLDTALPAARLSFMLTDTGAPVVLTQQAFAADLAGTNAQIVCVDSVALADQNVSNPSVTVSAENLAYVIYTSGSTGIPKGVALTHGSASALLHWAQGVFSREQLRYTLAATSISFDLSIYEIFLPLSVGTSIVLARNALDLPTLPGAGLVTLINTVPSAIRELLRLEAIPASVQTINLAGEALSAELVRRLYEQTSVAQVWNLYGPTEDTTYSTAALMEPEVSGLVTIGRPITGTEAYVLDDELEPVPVGVTGELYLSGAGLARGYLKRAELTAERFVPNRLSGAAGARMYRTGDLARYRSNGEIEYLGRTDHQVKVRGYRIELGEIEAVISADERVRAAVVVADDQRLVAYVVLKEQGIEAELRRRVQEKLPDYMTPAVFVALEELPLTANGKVDRKRLPAVESQSLAVENYVAPRNSIEEMVAGIWSQVLHQERIGVHDNFFSLGGHSLLATQIISRITNSLGAALPLRLLFESPTIAELAERIVSLKRSDAATLPPLYHVSRQSPLPLSFAQQRLWFLDQFEPSSHTYNMPGAVRIGGLLNVIALERSLNEIVRRHESLRTRFPLVDGEPVQAIDPFELFDLPVEDLSVLPELIRETRLAEITTRHSRQIFSLSSGPLLHMNLVRLAVDEHVLLVTMHHIISDGWSLELFFQELSILFQAFSEQKACPLPELKIQYADFAHWQRQVLQGASLESLLNYWRRQLGGPLPILELPYDHMPPRLRSFAGNKETLVLSAPLTDELKAFSRREGVTLFMTLVAAFKVLLYRYSGQEDIIVGTPAANRNQFEAEELIGFFVNTLILRSKVSGTQTFRDLLDHIRETVIDASAHQEMPFEKLVEELHPDRDTSRNPFFQVMVAWQKTPATVVEFSGVTLTPLEVETATAKFDLTLNLMETPAGLRLNLEYSTDIFKPATIGRMATHLKTLLEHIVADPGQRISQLRLLEEAERRQLLQEFNETGVCESELALHQFFERQAAATRAATALLYGEEQVSYGELNERANQLAHYLRSLGVGPETLVGVLLERTPDLIVALLGVLKTGAAYVPLDPASPAARLSFVLADAGAAVVLTEAGLARKLARASATVICVDSVALEDQSVSNPSVTVSAENLAYVIYTSGSTGIPKGVALTHGSTSALLHWAQGVFSREQLRYTLAATSVSFDHSIYEIFLPLSVGTSIVLARNALELPTLPGAGLVTLINTVPSAIRELLRLEAIPASVHTINLAGEALSAELVRRLYEQTSVEQVWNLYGPTEDTTYSTAALIEPEVSGLVTIGRPITGTEAYVLDDELEPVPVGVTGELYLSGAGLARGYLKRAELTAERFVPNPLSEETGARMYRTGDLARYRSNGEIEYLGRTDHQVKVRGSRLKLGEIEAVISADERVSAVVVVANDQTLVAYVVLKEQGIEAELRRRVQEKLPDYMAPAVFVALEELPLTANGKIDLKRLPTVELQSLAVEDYVAPRNSIEEMVAEIWSQVLHQERIGVHDNFFSLGGHSLLATQIVTRLRESFHLDLPLRQFFESPTVAGVASIIDKTHVEEADPQLLAEMLSQMATLSGAELKAMLDSEKTLM
ncbi:MAG TPA: amino acid adenylation domain-containing protein [Pyrinomonadaceae bacterium]|nr:amino acid adenylation domain-containing protein [Pyrinomonadaceae bacterium]